MTDKAIAQLSADASLLISEISRKQPGTEITWAWMSKIVGWDLQKSPTVLTTVKNRLLRDYNLVLSSIRGVGYRLLTSEEIVEGELAKDREKRRRAALRSKRKASAVNLSELDEAQRIACIGEIASAHVAAEASRPSSLLKLTQATDGKAKQLALNNALQALKRNINHTSEDNDD